MTTEQLILSIGTILLVARLCGWIFLQIRQPRVVGEMVAGILLGPSFFGRFFPGSFSHVFPASALPTISVLSQLGLLLFMFVVGVEVDLKRVLKQGKTVVLISNVSILLPLALGIAMAKTLYPEFAGLKVPFPTFALFMGAAMSVTAFPVLARILKERDLLGTSLGTVSISCAAIDDISAWLLLAVLTAMAHSYQGWSHLWFSMFFLALFIFMMLVPVRWIVSRLEFRYRDRPASIESISVLILFMLAASWTTERLQVHALFGAFMAGLVLPKSGMMEEAVERIESLSVALLLPLFFALTGLRTRIDLLTDKVMWEYALAIMAIAVAGKLAGAAFTAKLTGMNWRDSVGLGALMNTRGLVELVILNAGLDLGILSPSLFTMLVLMALATTFMASPALDALGINRSRETKTS